MAPRVIVVGLASDFGCQVQMTNIEDHLLDVLGRIDLVYWQLAASGHMPEAFDVAVVEGAVTTEAHVELLRRLRATASVVIVIGSCAVLGGIPALATGDLDRRYDTVYGAGPAVARGRRAPAPVGSVIDVDYRVPGCPIDPEEFVQVLHRAVRGLADRPPRDPVCAACKTKENVCLLERGTPCLGLVTRTGCGARCVSVGRACTGCRGVSPEANLAAARDVYTARGLDPMELDRLLSLYNTLTEVAR